ncbi:MAG TPA: ABC transporter permease [bacterium]|nr:ABC transporter permease [bacterium]
MFTYICRRILISIPLLLGISFITFLFIHIVPGNYFDRMRMDPLVSEETIARMEAEYHLDKPVVVQFSYWMRNLARLDLGYSFELKQPVSAILKERLFNTLILSISALLFTWLIAVPLGIFCAVKQYSALDKIFSFLSFVGMSLPNFFFALLLLFGASMTFHLPDTNPLHGILPLGGMRSAGFEGMSFAGKCADVALHLVIPTLVIGTGAIAALQRITRGNMLEVLRAQYVTTARAKGLPEGRVLYRHALRNAINPLVTILGGELSGLLSGAALTEIICNWPGLGSIMLTAVRSQDLYLVMGDVLIGGCMLIAGYLIADILLAVVDPTITYK